MITEIKNTKPFYNTEIPGDWFWIELVEVIDSISNGLTYDPENNAGFPITRIETISDGTIDEKKVGYTPFNSQFEKYKLKQGDILYSHINSVAHIGKTAFCFSNYEILHGMNLLLIKANSKVEKLFLYFLLNSNFGRKEAYASAKRAVNQASLSTTEIKKFKFPLPPLPEQKAIAQVLSTADAAIHTTEKLIAQKELRKKWLMQQLLSGRRRLDGFKGEIKLKVVGQFIKEISERNKDLQVTRVLSVTNSRGFINQSDQFDRTVASEDASNYKIVRKGQFAYNPSRVNVGSLDLLRNFKEGILSPMYVVFSTDEKHLLADFLYFHLKTQRFYGHIPMFVQGSVRDSLSFDGLCSMKFFIPSIEEQTGITRVLQTAEKEITLLKFKVEKLREKKKGLMQQLLTGKVRLKIK